MPDPRDAPDPVDQAYVQAETLLDDEAARAARRDRILGAVARGPAWAATAPSRRSPAWRRGGWLAAACVAGLSLFTAAQVYEPTPRLPQTAPAAPTGPTAAAPASAAPPPAAAVPANRGVATASPEPAAPAASPPARQAFADASAAATPAPAAAPPAEAPPVTAPVAPRPPPAPAAPAIEQPRRAFPAAPVPTEIVVTAERRAPAANEAVARSGEARDGMAEARGELARPTTRRESSDAALAAPPANAPLGKVESSAGPASDPAARLRAAAAAGRTAEVEALLDQGVAVDAPDADGDTALIDSVRADHPAAAAALRRHGASLDHRNHAGESARDLAAARGDAALDRAIGFGP